MNRLIKRVTLALFIFSASVVGLTVLRHATSSVQAGKSTRYHELQAVGSRLAELNEATTLVQESVARKKARIARTPVAPNFSPELLEILTSNHASNSSKGNLASWDELREQLGISWNSSQDYVLVRKPLLNRFNFGRLYAAKRATDTANAVLALAPQEQADIAGALQQAGQTAVSRLQRIEPTGDVVAQYTIQPDQDLQASISNQFASEITAILGPERSDLFLPSAWRELKPQLTPDGSDPVTMTIRSVGKDEPKLVWELKQGESISTGDVRYAYYPSSWFLTLFPGGWEPIVTREGFELPQSFRN
jgi:hypothetical protein